MEISTAELGVRLLVYLFVLVGAPAFFVGLFRLMDYAAHEPLVREFDGRRAATDTGQLNAYFRQAEVASVSCTICGAANAEHATYCYNCQERLPK